MSSIQHEKSIWTSVKIALPPKYKKVIVDGFDCPVYLDKDHDWVYPSALFASPLREWHKWKDL